MRVLFLPQKHHCCVNVRQHTPKLLRNSARKRWKSTVFSTTLIPHLTIILFSRNPAGGVAQRCQVISLAAAPRINVAERQLPVAGAARVGCQARSKASN